MADKEYLTLREVLTFLEISETTYYRWKRMNVLPHPIQPFGKRGKVKYRAEEIKRFKDGAFFGND